MDVKTLIAECTAYDFKLMLEEKKSKSWLKSVSAFANGLGGSIFFGINNDGIVRGLDDVQNVCETISSKVRDYMEPLPDVELIPHDTEGCTFCTSNWNEHNIVETTDYVPMFCVVELTESCTFMTKTCGNK